MKLILTSFLSGSSIEQKSIDITLKWWVICWQLTWNYKIRFISIVLGKNVILQSVQAYGSGFLYENNYNIYLIFISSFLQAMLIAVYNTYLNINWKVCWFHVSNSCPQHNNRTIQCIHNITRVHTVEWRTKTWWFVVRYFRVTDTYHLKL